MTATARRTRETRQTRQTRQTARQTARRARPAGIARVWWFGAVLTCVYAAIAGRLVAIQHIEAPFHAEAVEKQLESQIRISPRRGPILDATGRPLALIVETRACAIDPATLENTPGASLPDIASRLQTILRLTPAETHAVLVNAERRRTVVKAGETVKAPYRFVWVKRRLPEDAAARLAEAMREADESAAAELRQARAARKRAGDVKIRRDGAL